VTLRGCVAAPETSPRRHSESVERERQATSAQLCVVAQQATGTESDVNVTYAYGQFERVIAALICSKWRIQCTSL